MIPLLPFQVYLAQQLWPDLPAEEQQRRYRLFVAETQGRSRLDPAMPTAGVTALVSLVVGIALSVGSALISRSIRPATPKRKDFVGPQSSREEGGSIRSNRRFTPREGFDSVQAPAVLGDPIPVVAANREVLFPPQYPGGPAFPQGFRFGGVRVNLPLIWSQLWSYESSQMLRAIFMVGQAPIENVEPQGFAIGDNSLSGYDFQSIVPTEAGSRYTIYASLDGGRVDQSDRIAGRTAANDPGNLQAAGAESVFDYRTDIAGGFEPGFSYTYRPSTSTQFGLYSWCANGMPYRLRPNPSETITCTTRSINNGVDTEFFCSDDPGKLGEMWAAKYCWSRRCGITTVLDVEGNPIDDANQAFDTHPVDIGETVWYYVYSSSDITSKIRFNSTNTDNDPNDPDADRDMGDVGSAVAGYQHQVDDALVVGEIFKCGTALLILDKRTTVGGSGRFASSADSEPPGGGTTLRAEFIVARPGRIGRCYSSTLAPAADTFLPPLWERQSVELETLDDGERYNQASQFPQLCRCAIASIELPRRGQLFEIGFRSTIGLRVNNMPNWRSTPKIKTRNNKFGDSDAGIMDPVNPPQQVTIVTGSNSTIETRYSLFMVYYCKPGECFIRVNAVWAIRGNTGEAAYNYLRLLMPEPDVGWKVRFEPLMSWEVKINQYPDAPVHIIDNTKGFEEWIDTENNITFWWNGDDNVDPDDVFTSQRLEPNFDIGYGYTGEDTDEYLDSYAQVAEGFAYDEVEPSLAAGPENEIVYVNSMQYNGTAASYKGIATVGINIQAGREFNQFSQFSAYCYAGTRMYRHITEDFGPTHLFPDIYRDLLLNQAYGTGEVTTIQMIDVPAFKTAAQWCQNRYYFWDGVLAEPENIDGWASDVAATMLLDVFEKNGAMSMKPAVAFDPEPTVISQLFTAGNIKENTLSVSYLPLEDRLPIRVAVKFREERSPLQCLAQGFFPQDRTIVIREATTPDDAPLEELDLSLYCTNRWHAIDAAAYLIRSRRLVDHTISFDTTPAALTGNLGVCDYIHVGMDWRRYDAVANGIILADGTLVTTQPDAMGPGSYEAIVWDGGSGDPAPGTVVVAGDGTATPTNHLFALESAGSRLTCYKTERVSVGRDGTISVEASHHPTDEADVALIGKDWPTYAVDGSDPNWVLEEW